MDLEGRGRSWWWCSPSGGSAIGCRKWNLTNPQAKAQIIRASFKEKGGICVGEDTE